MNTEEHHDMALYSLELCAGVGMLGEGLRAGLAHLGRESRTICYVEREAHAAAVLAARVEEGSLDAAPVWSDMLTFDGRRFRGLVDLIAAGFPCQDLSVAGSRAGLDGARSGLFFRVLEIADDCDARGLFLENVAGIATATSTVVDEVAAAEITGESYRPVGRGGAGVDSRIREEDGAVLERAAARVLGELADRGWNAEWLTFPAADTGAAHGRERWFCFAWRELADPYDRNRSGPELRGGASHAQSVGGGAARELDDPARHGGDRQERQGGRGRAESEPSMWRTPDAPNSTGGPRNRQASIGKGHQVTIAEQAEHWTSPTMNWPTPTAQDSEQAGGAGMLARGRSPTLNSMATAPVSARPTPASRDYRSPNLESYQERTGTTKGEQLPNFVEHHFYSPQVQQTRDGQSSSPSSPTSPLRLNPLFVAWLMGWPSTWTIAAPHASSAAETVLWRCRLQSHLSSLLEGREC